MRSADFEMPDSPLSWRLLAANNRDVARSATPYPDLATCLKAVADLQARIEDAVAVAARSGRADWSWRLRVDGQDVAVSSRTYQRRLQCEAACSLFVSLVHDATLDLFDFGPDHVAADDLATRVVEAADAVPEPVATRPQPLRSDADSDDEPVRVPQARERPADA
jgi:uncharacterized protein YegP (UPF0339 family)